MTLRLIVGLLSILVIASSCLKFDLIPETVNKKKTRNTKIDSHSLDSFIDFSETQYILPVKLGDTKKDYKVMLDTSSIYSWFPSTECGNCSWTKNKLNETYSNVN